MNVCYTIYKEYDSVRIEWNGKYTRGRTWCRGTHVHLTDLSGKEIGCCEAFHRESLDEIINDLNNNFTLPPYYNGDFRPIKYDKLKRIINGDYCFTEDENGELFNNEFNGIENYDFTHETVKNAELIIFDGKYSFVVIYNKQNIIDELTYVNNIAKENNVEFFWV